MLSLLKADRAEWPRAIAGDLLRRVEHPLVYAHLGTKIGSLPQVGVLLAEFQDSGLELRDLHLQVCRGPHEVCNPALEFCVLDPLGDVTDGLDAINHLVCYLKHGTTLLLPKPAYTTLLKFYVMSHGRATQFRTNSRAARNLGGSRDTSFIRSFASFAGLGPDLRLQATGYRRQTTGPRPPASTSSLKPGVRGTRYLTPVNLILYPVTGTPGTHVASATIGGAGASPP